MWMRTGEAFRAADVIRVHAAHLADKVALCHGERELSFAELDERTNRLANALLSAGVRPGSRVAYLDRTAPEGVELLLAAAKIRAVAVPLN
jgi:acyl-CoA synthetase (AMP-forming)/AMP-acid ligase II